jgi:cytochrome oxidase Cu insertion factor (SCO1/SenC/PrrC family)
MPTTRPPTAPPATAAENEPERPRLTGAKLLLLVAAGLGMLLLAGSFAFVTLRPLKVVPRQALAPGWQLVDQRGAVITSEDVRGALVVYTFAPADCGERCRPMDARLAEIRARLDEADTRGLPVLLLTVALDAGTPELLAHAAAARGADGEVWRFVGGDAAAIERTVRAGFRVWYEAAPGRVERFDPAFVLVDGTGLVREHYRVGVPPVEHVLEDLALIAREARAAVGFARYAYEAAHLFGCFPR